MITKAELEKHNTESDCWIVQYGLVMDLPEDFLNEHPGGPEVITSIGGRDVTSDFEDIGHSDEAREWANKYIIGWLEGAEGSEEELKTKEMPKTKDVREAGGGAGGGLGLVPVVLAIIAAAAAYYFLKG